MQRGLRVITLQGATEKSPILLSQYWKNEWLDGTIIISYFGGSNNIFADFRIQMFKLGVNPEQNTKVNFKLHNRILLHFTLNNNLSVY